jgi:prepilin-type N-terminal cleavage/methylation domain-containing protein
MPEEQMMNKPQHACTSGFTIIEMMVTLIIIAIVLSFAIPSFFVWLPNYRLSSAARDLFSSMQQARMSAVKANGNYTINFDTANQIYTVLDNSGGTVKTVNLSDYGSNIQYGNGAALNTFGGGAGFDDFVTYTAPVNTATFTPRGLANEGYVYLTNEKNTAYVVGSQASGVIIMKKWSTSAVNWE